MTEILDQKTNKLLNELREYSPETYAHSISVAKLCNRIAREMKFDEEELESLHYASLLHDIGKLKIPTDILHKPAKLTPDEFEIIKQHSKYTKDILTENDFPQDIITIAYHHHEKLNGTGYLEHLSKEDISDLDEVLIVADIAEALSAKRSYKDEMSIEGVSSILNICADKGEISPEIVNIAIDKISNPPYEEQNQ